MFKDGRSNIHDEERSGRPSIVSENLKQRVDRVIQQDRRFTLDSLQNCFLQISRSLLHEVVTDHLGYRKICARWVPKKLTDQHKENRMVAGFWIAIDVKMTIFLIAL
jgi:hypothetical protein